MKKLRLIGTAIALATLGGCSVDQEPAVEEVQVAQFSVVVTNVAVTRVSNSDPVNVGFVRSNTVTYGVSN